MERQVFEILEEKIDQAMKKMEALSLENLELKTKYSGKRECYTKRPKASGCSGRRKRAY